MNEVCLKVENLTCTFCLDHHDRTIFLYSDYTAVEIEKNRQAVEEQMKSEKMTREHSAADSVYSELSGLLIHAHKRGLSMEQSFQHFDVNKYGYIDVDMLIDGLGRLGVGVTYPVAEKVLEMIGGMGSNFLTMADFELYLTKQLEQDSLYSTTNIQAHKNRTNTSSEAVNTASKKVSSPSKKMINKDLLPPEKDWQSIQKSFMDISLSQTLPMFEEENEDDKEDNSTLPLPEESYHTGKSSSQQSLLPTWARNRSKRALHSLQTSHERLANTLKKRQEDNSKVLYDANENNNLNTSSAPPSPSRQNSIHSSTSSNKSKKSSKSSKSNKNNSSSSEVTMLNLQTVRDESLADQMLLSSKDELLHLDHGVIMTYRILDGIEISRSFTKTREKNDTLRYHSILTIREKNLMSGHHEQSSGDSNVSNAAESEEKNQQSSVHDDEPISFTIIVVPDLTMTLDTLQLHIESILHSYPYARIVLVGLLGLPNTVWPSSWILNSDLQARTIAHLVEHLHNNNKLFFISNTTNKDTTEDHQYNLLLLGFGTGAFHLSRFLSQHLPSMPPIVKDHIKSALFVNGFLRLNKKIRLVSRDFRYALTQANISEAHELITSLHFYDDYLAKYNREECLKKFWSTRRNLYISNESSTPVKTLSGFIGVLEQLRGLLVTGDDFDGAMLLVETNIPIIVIQSTEDVFIDPKVAAIYSPNQLPPNRYIVQDIVDVLEPNAVYIAWLKAGHEVLQERNSFILGILSTLAKLLGVKEQQIEEKVVKESAEEYDPFDVLSPDFKYGEDYMNNEKKYLMN
jgi:hypothetical protein